MVIKFKPMLAVNADMDKIVYPCFASNKLDGIRVVFKDGEMLARSLKPIRNGVLQNKYQWLKDLTKSGKYIFDGEMYCHEMTFQEITHYVMKSNEELPETYNDLINMYRNDKKTGKPYDKDDSDNYYYYKTLTERIKELEDMSEDDKYRKINLTFNCFDCVVNNNYSQLFHQRHPNLHLLKYHNDVTILEQREISDRLELDKEFERVLNEGYEGLILRGIDSPYKCGRSTVNEGFLLKVKPFLSFDAKVLEITQRYENMNESETNELGRSFKRNTVDMKKPTGIAAAFVVEYNGIKGHVTLTGDEAFRREIWKNSTSYIGKMIEYKAMLVGAKDFPRHANFMRYREDRN